MLAWAFCLSIYLSISLSVLTLDLDLSFAPSRFPLDFFVALSTAMTLTIPTPSRVRFCGQEISPGQDATVGVEFVVRRCSALGQAFNLHLYELGKDLR